MGNDDIHRLEAASKATAEFDSYFEDEDPKKQKKRRHWLATTIVIILILATLGGGGYYWYKNHHKVQKPVAHTHSSTPTPLITTQTKQYSSDYFNLSFNYPANWIVNENAGGLMTVTSPALKLKSATDTTYTGQVVVKFRDKQQPLPEFNKGNATAVLASQTITYTQPSQVQEGSAYISFLNFASSADSTELDGIFITGNAGYQLGQSIPATDLSPVDPIISVLFLHCANTTCSGTPISASISSNMWNDTQFATPITHMLESLTINS